MRADAEKKRNVAGSPTTRADLAGGDVDLRPLLHAERDDAQRPQRAGGTGDGQAGRLDADVVAAADAAADADAFALFGEPVVRRPAGDGEVEVVVAFEDLWPAAAEPTSDRVG